MSTDNFMLAVMKNNNRTHYIYNIHMTYSIFNKYIKYFVIICNSYNIFIIYNDSLIKLT